MGDDVVVTQLSSVPVVTPGRTCSVIMSSVSAAKRPATRMPAKSSGAWMVMRLASTPPSIPVLRLPFAQFQSREPRGNSAKMRNPGR